MKQVWSRALAGRPSVVVGGPIPVATVEGVRPLRVPCDLPRGPLGPLIEAQARARRLLGRNQPLLETAADRLRTGLRRTLLGDAGPEDAVAQVVATLNLLAQASSVPRALVLDSIEAADPATLTAVRRIIERPGWLEMPLILGVREAARGGRVTALVEAMRETAGDEAILEAHPGAAEGIDEGESEPVELPPDLPPAVRKVLRAAALAGPAFEARLVAELLHTDELSVLERLQDAVDAGVPVEDDGDGGFRLPAALARRIEAGLLPSLARAWHRSLAELLAPAPSPGDSVSIVPPSEPGPADSVELAPEAPIRGPRISTQPAAMSAEAIWAAVVEAEADARSRARSLEESLADGGGVEGRGHDRPSKPPAGVAPVERTRLAPIPGSPFDSIETPFGSVDMAPGAADPDKRMRSGPAELMEDALRSAEASLDGELLRADIAPDESVDVVRGLPALGEGWPDDSLDAAVGERPLEAGLAEGLVARADADEGAGVGLRNAALAGAGLDPGMGGRPAPRSQPSRPPGRVTQVLGDAARAADHLAAAGDPTGATAKLIQAAVDAAALGAAERALHLTDEALAALDRLPDIAAHRALRARALAEAARIQWTGVGPDARFTLEAARETAAAAEAALDASAPTALVGEVASLRAQILHDVGGEASLREALDLLTAASKQLEAAGDPIEAARLFNDQAAIWVRMGDPVRAHGLLEASRRVFAARSDHDPSARLELADTDHLIARLPLHVAARAGREDDAAALGLRHAGEAERTYGALGRPWDRARVWESIGRLELMRGRIDRAIDSLEQAAALQQRLGDVLGLASTVEALARALTAAGRPEVALTLLHDSLALNAEKGSVQGVGFLQRTLKAVTGSMTAVQRQQLGGRIAALEGELDRVARALSVA